MTDHVAYRLNRAQGRVEMTQIDLAAFDAQAALSLREACVHLRGRSKGGKKKDASLAVVQRWANPKRGWEIEVEGRRFYLVLPSVKVGGERLTMPAWVKAFETVRLRLSITENPAAR